MGKIAIVANPNSSKDVRRLVTHATVIDNSEKVNIPRRIIAGVSAMGDHELWMMPDRYRLAQRAINGMGASFEGQGIHILPMTITDIQADTSHFVEEMARDHGADVVIVLGGRHESRRRAYYWRPVLDPRIYRRQQRVSLHGGRDGCRYGGIGHRRGFRLPRRMRRPWKTH